MIQKSDLDLMMKLKDFTNQANGQAAESYRAYTVPSTVNDLRTHQENDLSSYREETVAKKTEVSRRGAFGKKNK